MVRMIRAASGVVYYLVMLINPLPTHSVRIREINIGLYKLSCGRDEKLYRLAMEPVSMS